MGILTAEVPKDALRAWAAARGLAYEEEGLLPPISSVLRLGLGVGPKRAGLITDQSGGGYTARGGFTRREERHTFNLCKGALPGGIDGVLAHHQHLETRSGSEGETWVAAVDTVVVARLPERSRAVCELRYDGGGWRAERPEDAAAVAAVTRDVRPGAETRVEYVDGVLCVWVPGIVEDGARLDALCAVAATLAAGMRSAIAGWGELDVTRPLPPPSGPRQAWIDENVTRVRWDKPPASVLDARVAYEAIVADEAERAGGRAHLVVLVAGVAVSILWVLASVGFALLIDDYIALLAAPFGFLYGILKTFRYARESGQETVAGELVASAGPWGLEAFARGYARVRGLTVEDPDELRRRFTSPVGGRPLRALQGDLGGGVPGHLAIWRDWVRETHWLIAIVAAPPGPEPAAVPPYQASRSGGLLVLGRQVTDAERTAAELDALAAEARRLASRHADPAGAQPVAAGEAGPPGAQPGLG